MKPALQILSRACLNLVLPPRCPVSGKVVEEQGTVSPESWAKLSFLSPPFCACCGTPFGYESGEEKGESSMLCAECLAFPKPYERARAVFSYENPCRQMILAFKHGDQTHLAPSFATWLKTGGAEFLGEADALVPVPLHWLRLLKRRYNQAALLGRELGKKSGIPHWPDVLKRVRNTPSQGHKGVGNRRKNVSGVFVLAPSWREKTPGKRLVLIDDVLTTGATVEECARVLIQEGKAARVDVLTIARVLRDRDRLAT